MARERVVEFAVKARDEYSKVLKNLEQQQTRLSAAAKASGRRAVLGVAEGELNAAVANYKRLNSEVERYRAVQANASKAGSLSAAEMRELGETIKLVRDRSREAAAAIQTKRAALGQINSAATTGYAAFDRLATAMQREAGAADAAKTALVASAAAEERAAAVAARKVEIQQRLNAVVQSGFAHWSRYVDAINRVRAADEKAAAVAALKAQIQERLNNPTQSGFAAFIRNAEAADREAVAVADAATQLNKLTAASKTAATAQGALKAKTDAATESLTRQRGRGGAKGGAKGDAQDVEVFGLKPWQLTNLGYQVNDVVSGLAMGQAPLQILAQQAGQFAQIWPGVMVALARSIPILTGVTAVLSPFIAAAMRMHALSESIQIFSRELALSADGSRYSAEELANATQRMGEFGIATDAARTIIKQFVKDGISQKDFEPLAKLAKQLDDVTGEGVGEAGKRLSTAFSGTVEDVRDLDKELNFLTASQLETIRAMEKAGDTTGAMSFAQAALAGKLAASAGEASEWTQATDAMAEAWDNLVTAIERSGVLGFAARQLKLFAQDVKAVADVANNVANAVGGTPDLEAARAKLVEINATLAEQKALLEEGHTVYADIGALEAQRAALAEIVDARRAELEAIKDGSLAQQEAGALTEADKKARLDIQEVIDKQGEALLLETKQVELTNRERYIEAELLKAKNAALEKAKALNQDVLDLTAEQTKQIRNQAGMAFDATHVNYEAQYTAQRGTPQGAQMAALVAAVSALAEKMQLSAKDLLTAISFETKGTFNPAIMGGAGGKYAGLIQFSPENQARYGVNQNSSVEAQVEAAGKYLSDAGVKAGDSLLQIYAAINAGSASKINASDERNGGTPGTVLDKVSEQMDAHKAKAEGVLAAYAGIAEQAKKTQEYERDFNARAEAAAAELDFKTKENREAFIAKALTDEEVRAKKAGVELTQQQINLVKQQAAAQFDLQHANDAVNRLVAQRTALFESLQIAQTAGDQGKVQDVIGQIGSVEEKLKEAIPLAIAFWQAIGGSGAEQEIAKLRAINDGIGQTLQKLDKQFLPQAQQINEELADIGANAFGAFAQAIADGENAVQAFFNALLQGIAEFLIEIGKAIIKQALFNAISGAGGSGGIGGFITSLFHGGGVVGSSSGSGSKAVNPMIFAGAQRFHGGGIAGLGPNEVPIIALKDEEVITRDDPRHVSNGGAVAGGGGRGQGQGQAVNLKNINLFDPADLLEHALSNVAGERIFLNFLTRNSRKVAAAINNT
ncbi:phage tail length tape measure family protein [Mesorhizobium sp. M0145]|uniref:phage tail length tape measure family protein n=1 Tax=Mesorhizobium sp. M0145 TaxID=2956895 RepID=UPI00333A3B05